MNCIVIEINVNNIYLIHYFIERKRRIRINMKFMILTLNLKSNIKIIVIQFHLYSF